MYHIVLDPLFAITLLNVIKESNQQQKFNTSLVITCGNENYWMYLYLWCSAYFLQNVWKIIIVYIAEKEALIFEDEEDKGLDKYGTYNNNFLRHNPKNMNCAVEHDDDHDDHDHDEYT